MFVNVHMNSWNMLVHGRLGPVGQTSVRIQQGTLVEKGCELEFVIDVCVVCQKRKLCFSN